MLAGLDGADRVSGAERGHSVEPRLVHAAHQFEALMMKELLEPLSRSSELFDDGSEGKPGVLGEFASESLAGALSVGGGFGIAERVLHSLRSGNSSPSPDESKELENGTRISTGK